MKRPSPPVRVRSALALVTLFGLFGLAACGDNRLIVAVDAGSDIDAAYVTDAPPPPPLPLDGLVVVPPDAPTSASDVPAETDVMAGPRCGDMTVEAPETCDDGNSRPGDGCSGICVREPNYACATPGQPCVSTIVCGDGVISGSEACDDKNALSGDGCSSGCLVEPGWACAMAGAACVRVPTAKCGDGAVNQGELCDDGKNDNGDGCSATCTLEPGWTCPSPGKPCLRDEFCGNGNKSPEEQCDDGDTVPGDGCTGACTIEPFYTCPMPGKDCVTTIVCGDLKIVGDENCDDGNAADADGCSADCRRITPGYTCPKTTTGTGTTGGMCTMNPVERCGDSRLSPGEYCDDGGSVPMDGCSATCNLEPGYTCPTPGAVCTLVEFCGDGKVSVALGEQCDDGDKDGNDGCSALCVREANYVCPTPGQMCVSTIRCGDRVVSPGSAETCDDGNTINLDGCTATCTIETGWTCPAGTVCRPTRCGDGLRVGTEQCDDGDATNGDGCSSSCTLEGQDSVGVGWVCPTPGQDCVRTTCNNGMKEGSEACDDGNKVVGDGCTPYCQLEPSCPAAGGACSSTCGDGLILPSDQEECDDGNTNAGDGCSSLCKVEPGYTCQQVAGMLPNDLPIPVVYRDFIALPRNGSTRHGDFEVFGGSQETLELVQAQLGTDGKPVLNNRCTTGGTTAQCPYGQQMTNPTNFNQWYRDTAGVNMSYVEQLPLVRQPNGSYFFPNGNPNLQLFPLDTRGFVGTMQENLSMSGHNFGFTSEVRYWFTYNGGETLNFSGDDDVWVFISRRQVMDLGGVHPRRTGSVTLDAARAAALGLVAGNIYEFTLFHAERHTVESNFNLTMNGFASAKSTCQTTCGDGIPAGTEACDRGTAGNTGAYDTCNADCTLPPRCGDGVHQAGNEQCEGNTPAIAGRTCSQQCTWNPYCGNETIDAGEQCDGGVNNGKGYGFCTATCQLGPRCGDGVVTHAEECDPNVPNAAAAAACTATCTKKCGNGTPDPGEECDAGKAANTGGYGKCTAECRRDIRCGDGIKNDPSEACDDGKNDGAYGTCAMGCVLGPRCGDEVVQMSAGEICDKGAMNDAAAYAKDKCTTRCRPAPYCGDKAVDVTKGELCDDGVNSGQPGSCKVDCTGPVPLPSCGDGAMQAGEQCDLGAMNGAVGSTCDGQCRTKCGNGFKDSDEECDDGKNDGSYGTCAAGCKLAPYCGDNVKNGPEACDFGGGNQAAPYGPGTCTTMCTVGGYCGDGRIQSANGEQCEGFVSCNMCKKTDIE